jgi:glycosyltransferase involved in cell wall biosynthesis
MQPPSPIRVAIVAASLRILGGQAVQAQHNIAGFDGDREVQAWLVPIDPVPPAPFDLLLKIKYVRTVVTQLLYWPLLVRNLLRADVVHVFSAAHLSFLLSPLPAILIGKLLGRPVLLNYHSGQAPEHLRRSALTRFVLRRVVDLNVVPSRFLQDVFASFGINARVVANTIDVSRFDFRQRTPIRPRLLSTRNFEPLYNVACTLRAFALVQEKHPDATLTVIGGGSQEAALKQLAADLNLRQVQFTGRVPPSRIHEYYADADIYVQTPSIDNMPLSVLESFASGLPVVATNIGGVPAILTDGVHGYLAHDNDAEGIAAQIEAVLADPDEAHRRAEAARGTCAQYDWSVVRTGWIDAYRAVVDRRHVALANTAPAPPPAPVGVQASSPQGHV